MGKAYMTAFTSFFSQTFQSLINLLRNIGFWDLLDIAIITFLIYNLIRFIQKTSSGRVARSIIIVFIFVWLSDFFQLNAINYVLNLTLELGFLALVILFQPEIRKIFEQVGSKKFTAIFTRQTGFHDIEAAISQTVLACLHLSKDKTGALIVFERDISLEDVVKTGTLIEANSTSELLKNIFFDKAPLHDGAVIIRDGRIVSAGCMLPLSNNANLSRDLGMRHRAGIGVSEQSDAVSVIVSEETGSISVAVDGMLKRHLAPDTFEKLLRNELITSDNKEKTKNKKRRHIFKVKNK